jgi:hypothetical protein
VWSTSWTCPSRRASVFHWWGSFLRDWMCQQAKYALLGYRQPPRTPSEAFAFITCHRLVRNLVSWDYRPMVFRGKWADCHSHFRPLCEHARVVFFLPRLDEMDLGDIRFQQDGAKAHTSRASMAVLRDHFPGRLISLRGDLKWPARSPDLTPCDFFFVGVCPQEALLSFPPCWCYSRHSVQK